MISWIVTSSALMLAVIVLRFALRGRISLRLQYALWALVLLRLLVPVSPAASALSVMNAFPAESMRTGHDYIPSNASAAPAAPPAAAGGGSADGLGPAITYNPNAIAGVYHRTIDWGQRAVSAWLTGTAAVGLTLLISNLRFAGKLKRSRRDAGLDDRPLPVYVTDAIPTPCLFGLFRPAIYLTPEALADGTALRHVLEHETMHWRHRDHFWSFFRCVCLALHWYNPLVWAAAWLSRFDAELACDEATIRRLGDAERMNYGRTLIGLTCTKHSAGALLNTATTMTGGKKSLRERITRISKKQKTAAFTLVVVLLIAAAIAGCTFTGAKKTAEIVPLTAEEVAQYNEIFKQILTDGEGQYSLNPLCPFLTSYYDRPEDINLSAFLRYFPPEKDVTDQTEFEALKANDNWPFGPDAAPGHMPVPIHRIPASAVNNALKKYAGITLKALSGVGMKGLIYLNQYDAYYTYTSDAGAGHFTCDRGEKQGNTVRLYGDTATLTLKKNGDGFLFVSRREPESAAKAAPEPSVLPSPSTSAAPAGTAPAALSGGIHNLIQDLTAGKTVEARDLLPCLEGFTRATWLELEKAHFGTDWWNPFLSALNSAALSDRLSDTEEQKLRDYYIGKAYLTSDGAYTEGLDSIVMKQWTRDPVTYSACLRECFSATEAANLRRMLTPMIGVDSLGQWSPFGLTIPGSVRSIYLETYPVDFPFGCALQEKSRRTFKAESFGQVTVVESDGLQVTYLNNGEGVFTVITIRTDKHSYGASGVPIGESEEFLPRFYGELKKLGRLSDDDEAWFGTDYDAAYAYTPAESTKSIVYLVKGGRVSGIELIEGLDGAMY